MSNFRSEANSLLGRPVFAMTQTIFPSICKSGCFSQRGMISRTSPVAASCIFNPLTHLCILSCRQVHLLGLRGLTVYCSRTVVLVGRQLSELLGLADALRDGRIRERKIAMDELSKRILNHA